jgi:ribosomal peptide maturation radical SAM protein 1
MRVALVVMPFASTLRPNLATGLLQSGLRRQGVACETKYLNFALAELLGEKLYTALATNEIPMTVMAGEWIFSQLFFGHRLSDWDRYEREVLDDRIWGINAEQRAPIRVALEVVPRFLRQVFEAEDWGRYDLVGFTSTFEQTMPSLCLARMIRDHFPDVLLAAGGANFEAEMGRPYMEQFGFLDFVSTTEADLSFPQLALRLAAFKAGRTPRLEVPPGILYRSGTEVCESSATADVVNLDDLPTPDFTDFFDAVQDHTVRADAGLTAPVGADFGAWLPVETSRGCWWGQKAHCTFCGLNGKNMAFRQKSWRRVVEETDQLLRSHPEAHLQFSDNILAMNYFKDLLPFWAEHDDGTVKFFEIKANLRRDQVELMARAGIRIVQAGIESLSDKTLDVMQKGILGAQNLSFLRWCAELGVSPQWNLLYGFPEEDLTELDETLALLRLLDHLPPPTGAFPIRMDRFSPNFVRWREKGFTTIAPMPAYGHVYPFSEDTLHQAAYYFQYQHPQLADAIEAGRKWMDWVTAWKQRFDGDAAGELAVQVVSGGFHLRETRYGFQPYERALDDAELALLLACDQPTLPGRALQRAAAVAGPSSRMEEALDDLTEGGVIARVGRHLVNLALLDDETRRALQEPKATRVVAA